MSGRTGAVTSSQIQNQGDGDVYRVDIAGNVSAPTAVTKGLDRLLGEEHTALIRSALCSTTTMSPASGKHHHQETEEQLKAVEGIPLGATSALIVLQEEHEATQAELRAAKVELEALQELKHMAARCAELEAEVQV
eukprot:COSAG01_NODE_8088_length_2925_cov_7.743100_2_plen_136_part_00